MQRNSYWNSKLMVSLSSSFKDFLEESKFMFVMINEE